MNVTAKAKYIKTSPRKSRVVVDLIRGMNVNDALDQLRFTNKKVTDTVSKLINSAVASAEHNYRLDKNNLFIKEIKVDSGPILKRWMPRAHGRATPIRKRMSHINLILSEIKDSGEVKAIKQEIEAPVKLGEESKVKKDAKKSEKNKVIDKKGESASAKATADKKEQGKDIVDPRGGSRGGHSVIEGGKSNKGFMSKMFRRKSG